MPRYKLTVEYDGTPFSGWQRQKNGPSVQAVLERAASKVAQAETIVFGAGRTDSGVHATGQVAHLDMEKPLPADKLREALNHHIRPDPVAILDVEHASDDFHSRFDATARHYVYRILNRRSNLALQANRAWRMPQQLDADKMQAAAQFLIGTHDFTTFRDSQCQAASPVKSLDTISIHRLGEIVEVSCSARSFLHRQVRSIVGSLVEVGRGKQSVSWFSDILAAADRTACGPVAPPDGLYLVKVDYPASGVAK